MDKIKETISEALKIIEKRPHSQNPQTESPIEEIFERKFLDFASADVHLKPQYQVKTICGNFRIDFLIEINNLKIGIECDGSKFHDAIYDFWRDSLILGTSKIEDIVRIKGRQINRFIYSALYQIGRWYPNIYTQRNFDVLKTLCIKEFNEEDEYLDYLEEKYEKLENEIEGFEPPPIDQLYDYEMDIERGDFLTRRCIPNTIMFSGHDLNWKQCYNFAVQNGKVNLKEVIEDFKEQYQK